MRSSDCPWVRGVGVAIVLVASACARSSETDPVQAPTARSVPNAAKAPAATELKDASSDAATTPHTVRDEATFGEYFSLKTSDYDVRRNYERSYAKMSAQAPVPLDRAVALCRVSIIEPAPLPTSKWDRANGRDLMLETIIEGAATSQDPGALGASTFYVRAEDALRAAAAGQSVRWVLRDRDQDRAFPYHTSIEVGAVALPKDASTQLQLSSSTMRVDCRGATVVEASTMLVADADAALAAVEKGMAWTETDPRSVTQLRSALQPAADAIRIGSAIASAGHDDEAWKPRTERLRAIVRAYRAREAEWFARLAPLPVGAWAAVGPSVSARVVDWVCPGVPKGADPGSLNDEQRDACALNVELKGEGAVKKRWDPNGLGEIYACRQSPFGFEALVAPGKLEGTCVLGFRRGKAWLKRSVEISSKAPVIAVVGGGAHARALRIGVDDAFALFSVPPMPTP